MRRAHANANAKTKSQHKSTATGFRPRGFPTPASNNRVNSRRKMSEPASRPSPGAHRNENLCGNQPVRRVHATILRDNSSKSFPGDDAAVLAQSSGGEPASPRHRAGVASMAWRTMR